MARFPTVHQALEQIEQLKSFVSLVQEYETDDVLEKEVLKTYAYFGSIQKVAAELNQQSDSKGWPLIDGDFVSNVIKGRGSDPLHKILRSNYMKKTRHIRNK